jgi:tetratricopeptide (TPR) repeat protein
MNNRNPMRFVSMIAVAFSLAFCPFAGTARADADSLSGELLAVQHVWEKATYETTDPAARKKSLEDLSARAAELVQKYPGRPEPLIWQGIVLSTYAGARGGMGALSIAKKSRDSLLAAVKLDGNALEGSAYTSLGALYYKVPGWPIGFGDHAQAAEYLRKALELNPAGIDPNYFYGELLFEDGNYTEALRYLQKALVAPPRPERPLADSGRRGEINALISRVRAKQG